MLFLEELKSLNSFHKCDPWFNQTYGDLGNIDFTIKCELFYNFFGDILFLKIFILKKHNNNKLKLYCVTLAVEFYPYQKCIPLINPDSIPRFVGKRYYMIVYDCAWIHNFRRLFILQCHNHFVLVPYTFWKKHTCCSYFLENKQYTHVHYWFNSPQVCSS